MIINSACNQQRQHLALRLSQCGRGHDQAHTDQLNRSRRIVDHFIRLNSKHQASIGLNLASQTCCAKLSLIGVGVLIEAKCPYGRRGVAGRAGFVMKNAVEMQVVKHDLNGGCAPGIRSRRADDIDLAAVVPNMELHVDTGWILGSPIGLYFNRETDLGIPNEVAAIGCTGARDRYGHQFTRIGGWIAITVNGRRETQCASVDQRRGRVVGGI